MLISKSITTLYIGDIGVYLLDINTITDEDFSQALSQELITKVQQTFKSSKRQKEWLGVRLLLKHVLGSNVQIAYKSSGAPFLINSNKHISISHSGTLVAIALSNEKVGIDLQIISDKPLKIKSRFLSNAEIQMMGGQLDALTAVKLWCAKEAVYKFLSIPETPLIGGIMLQQNEENIVEQNHGLNISFKIIDNAVLAIAFKS
jgi:phosphopantetheinyl transferase